MRPPTEKDSQLRQLSLMTENHNNLLEKILRLAILRKLIKDIRYHQMDLLPLIIAMWWVQHSPIRIEKKLHYRDLIGRHIKCEIRITIMIQFQGRLLVMIQICGHTVRILFDWTEGSFQILWKSTNFIFQEFLNYQNYNWARSKVDSLEELNVLLHQSGRSFELKRTVLILKSGLLDGQIWNMIIDLHRLWLSSF